MSVCKAMAVSPTPKSANNSALAGAALLPPGFQPELPFAVALSGGADFSLTRKKATAASKLPTIGAAMMMSAHESNET